MSPQPRNILVLRFSAMGDVALLAPVLRSFLAAFPDHHITVATRPKFDVFFLGSERLTCFPADVDSAYSGIFGVFKLFLALRKTKPDLILDLHDHLRTRIVCFLFRVAGVPYVRFNKGRTEKNALTRRNHKVRVKLPHTVERYRQAFSVAGFSFSILSAPHLLITTAAIKNLNQWLESKHILKNEMWFGLAPFAAHKTKIWPLENYSKLIRTMRERMPVKFFLFGGGKSEIQFFEQLQQQFAKECIVVAGQLKLPEELALIGKLDKMICVDSSNMHLAALLGVPTLSIWGGTHSDAGFGPFGNQRDAQIQVDVDQLTCRPCSVYGTESCWRGDFACLARISVDQVIATL